MDDKIPPTIRALDETVVNRIAAGEVIQRPANALKELLENSLDAKSTNIQITLKAGGLKLLQIQDNGTGIRKEDLSIVCKRFTTSKLSSFEDLNTIATFGFRGEALASISHVAHLTIITKTSLEPCAYKCTYEDGNLIGTPKMIAGNQGTTIIVEDLFYNIATRKKALKNPSEEFAKVADVVSKYAVHNPKVGFCLKKQGESLTDIRTHPNSTHVDNIKAIYGTNVARELLEVDLEDEKMKIKFKGFISNANYATKKPHFLLFINHRLVDSTALRKALENIYSLYLAKNSYPFMYLSLELDPRNVDVNVHPTKHEVFFLHEEVIIEKVKSAIEAKLAGADHSRAFYLKSKFLPSKPTIPSKEENPVKNKDKEAPVAPCKMVRTDPKAQKMDKFLLPSQSSDCDKDSQPKKVIAPAFKKTSSTNAQRREINLTSVLSLRREIEEQCSVTLREIFNQSTYVGCTKPHWLLFQSTTNLFCANIQTIMSEAFYQILLYEFGNFGAIKYSEPMEIKALLLLGLELDEAKKYLEDGPAEEVVQKALAKLKKRALMLDDYFSLEMNEEQNLITIPLLLDDYIPPQEGLPMYLLRLAFEVDWTSEIECFRTFCRVTAEYYGSFKYLTRSSNWQKLVEHTFFPVVKSQFLPPMNFSDNKCLLLIEDIQNLYKVFERC
ncbi:unnamed protein product [Bemisia tabaci]|uniref:DNA mismatch repair protein S5 domain-containing protein n=1 Tax=Bemisia tabaci TaxID=7038 RepID=A0A9P0AIU4_BEMTA|nr:unnamed protein product [Bemisia tabaci]